MEVDLIDTKTIEITYTDVDDEKLVYGINTTREGIETPRFDSCLLQDDEKKQSI